MTDACVIETADLQKRFDGVDAVRGLNLQVPAGSIYGFLGRNGAGKTTTIKVLLGMTRPTGGHACVFGLAADGPDASVAIRRRTGFVSEDKDLYDYMTVDEIIRFTAAFYPRWRAISSSAIGRRFELPPDRTIKALSRGMRTKLALLLALCRGAELLDPRRADLGARSGRHRRGAAGARRPRRRRGDDRVLLVASDRRGRPDRRSGRDHRSRPRGRDRRARRSARALPPHPVRVRRRRRRSRRSARRASSGCDARDACSRCCRAPAPTRCSTRRARSARCRSTSCPSR